MCGTRRPTSIWPRDYTRNALASAPPTSAAVEAALRARADDGPLFCVVSRLTWQKGMDLLAAGCRCLVALGAQARVLGSGEAALEGEFARRGRAPSAAASASSSAMTRRCRICMQGGGDAILIPSRFEPCGLTQLYGLRYGCVPVVARIGGLADTVIDANEAALAAGVATGFQFSTRQRAMRSGTAIGRARCASITRQGDVWQHMQQRGMKVRRLLGPQRRALCRSLQQPVAAQA